MQVAIGRRVDEHPVVYFQIAIVLCSATCMGLVSPFWEVLEDLAVSWCFADC